MSNSNASIDSSGMSRRRQLAISEGNTAYQAKRAELLRAAAEVFGERGYEGTTLNDIAARFGTDRASLYYYVASKKELFQAVFQDTARDVLVENLAEAVRVSALDLDAPQKLRLLVEQQVYSYEKNYPYVYLYINEDMAKVAFQSTPWAKDMLKNTRKFESIVSQVLEQGVAEGTFRDDVPVPLMARGLFGMINWTHRWFNPKSSKTNAREIADSFCKIFLQGVMREKVGG